MKGDGGEGGVAVAWVRPAVAQLTIKEAQGVCLCTVLPCETRVNNTSGSF